MTITTRIRSFWSGHGRTAILWGAFLLPLLAVSPWFVLPFANRIPYDSPLGMSYLALQNVPLMMTQYAVLMWLAWRSGWEPSDRRCLQIFLVVLGAAVVLPASSQALETLTYALQAGMTWREALQHTWQSFGPPRTYFIALSYAWRGFIIFLVLRAFAWLRCISLVEPDRALPASRPKVSISMLLIVTAIVAIVIGMLPTVLSRFLSADHAHFFVQMSLGMMASVIESSFLAVAIAAVGWLTLRPPSIMFPSLVAFAGVFLGLMYLAYRIRLMLPWEFGEPTFAGWAAVPFAISVVLSTCLIVLMFRSVGLHLCRPAPSVLEGGLS